MNQNLNSIVQQWSDDEYTSHNELPVNWFFNISLDNIPSEMSGEYDLKAGQMKLGLGFDICEYFGRLDQAITKENSSSNNELVQYLLVFENYIKLNMKLIL